jgi:hypothetical protein
MGCKSLAEALAIIEGRLGKDALQDGLKVIACLTDLLPDQKAVRKILKAAFSIDILTIFNEVCDKSPNKQLSALYQCTMKLYDDFGFKKTLIEDVLWTYGKALGLDAGLQPPPSQSSSSDTLSLIKMKLRPVKRDSKNELLITKSQIELNIYTSDGGTITYQYDFGGASGLGEDCLKAMEECLEDGGWHDEEPLMGAFPPVNFYELEARYEDGKIIEHHGIFDRLHIPEMAFKIFIQALCTAVDKSGLGGIIALDGFMMAIRPSEVKYCGVEFSEGGKLYHYRTTDLMICVGDRVVVPAGKENIEKEVTVKTVDFCGRDSPLYPLEKTKKIIRKIT